MTLKIPLKRLKRHFSGVILRNSSKGTLSGLQGLKSRQEKTARRRLNVSGYQLNNLGFEQ